MAVTRLWLCASMLLGSLLAFMPGPAPAAATAYSVAVVPALPATEIKRRWQPLLDQLSHDTGFVLHFRFYADNEQFEEGLLHGEPRDNILAGRDVRLVRHPAHDVVSLGG